jgi:hypothetical protein
MLLMATLPDIIGRINGRPKPKNVVSLSGEELVERNPKLAEALLEFKNSLEQPLRPREEDHYGNIPFLANKERSL